LHSAPPNDPAWNAQLEKERQEEIKVITDACAAMGAELHEVGALRRMMTLEAGLMQRL
jgi:OTU domain-containing protein 6